MENSYNDDPLGILSKPKQKQAAPSQEGGNDPLGILKKKAAPEPVGTPSANGTPPTSPSKSSSSSVSVQPTVIASSGNQVKDLVDYVKGTGSFDNAKAANSEAAQKAIPKIVARQAAKQKPLTEVGAVPRPKVLSEQDAQAKAKEALSDPLMNVWASRSPDPIGELQKGANAAYDGTKAFTVRNGNDASVYGQMAKIAERSFLPNEVAASAYLKSRGVDVEGVPDADLATIEPRNVTEKVALDRVSQGRTIKNLLATSTVEDAAVEYAASQDPALARQIKTLGTNYQHDLPNAMQGKLISDFLENPDVIARAEADPNVKNKYTVAAANLNSNFPDYAKTRIANIIGQERENRGDNNGIVNIVGQKATDKLVDELIAEGKLTASDKLVYQKYIQPKLSVLQSIGRGVGRAIPLTMAFTDEAPIETPGLAENFQNSLVGTLHGMAKSIEDTPSALGSVVGGDQKGKLYDVLKSDYTAKALDPKGTWHAITQNTGHLTGFMVPMILGGEVAQGVGIPAKAASALTAYLTFEGQNAEQAIKMFPGDPTKQYLHTALATGGDMFLSELLPLAKAASGAKAALRSEITNTINSFTDGNITAAVAKETLLKKAAKIVAGLPKENAKMGATMAGFSLFHNALDAAFGGRDVSAGQVADQAVDAFKSGFLGGSIISLATAGNSQKLTGSLVREMAERPDHFKALIEQGAKMDPSLAATANERIANLNEASLIWKDVQELPISDAQKEKYLLSALNQKVWERKAEATSDDVVKRGYQEKAKVAGQAKEAIYNGQDPATEHESFTQPEQPAADAFGYKEKIAAAKTEEEKAQIDKDYAAFQAGEQVAAEPKPEATEGNPLVRRETMLDQARELVRNSEIKGYTSETIKDAAENDPAKFEDYLQNIAEQAQDPGSRAVTLDTYGKDIVDLAERLSDSKQTSKNNNVTLSNGEQPTVSNRLSPEEKRGNQIGGSELQAASDAVGRISDPSENNKASVEELRDKQGKELEQISKNNGTWVADPFKEFGNAPQAIGSEHNVYLDKDGQTLTKLNSAVKYDTWQDYLDNLAIHNTLFPTEAYTLKGFTDLSGDLAAVVQQPVVRGKEATFEQVKEDMTKMGFEHIPPSENPETPYDFVNKKTGVVISDLHGENVLVDANGKLRYIDTVIKKKPVENEATIPPTKASTTDQGTAENSQGAKEATKFENPEEAVKHINSLPLSHVEGTRMGAKQAEGIYLSTEDANRYSSESNLARSVTVDIKNPKVTDYVENTNLQHEKIGQLLDANEVSASDISSEYRPELEKFAGKRDVTNEDVSNWYRSKEGSRINEDYFEQTVRTKAAKLITEQYKSEGHDALYIPATKNTEGELIVFDSNAVKFEPANDLSKEQKYTTKTGKYSVEYRDGKRVVVDKQGNVLPEYIKVKAKKGVLTDKEGHPRMVEQRNKVRDNVLREHDKEYKYNFGAKANTEEMPTNISDEQASSWVIQHSSNPAEVASVYASTPKETAKMTEIEQAIADNGIGKVKTKSYKDFGDKNNMTASKAKTYLNDKTGRSIDEIARELSDHTGLEITPQDIVDFMDRFPNGDAAVLRDGSVRQLAATRFEELTGIPLNDRVATQAAIEHYAAAEREAIERDLPNEMPDEERQNWLTEIADNEYPTDNFSEFIGEPTEATGQDKSRPEIMGSATENTGTEMAGRPTTGAEQGSSETPNSDGQDGPPAKEEPTALGEQDPEMTKMANAVNDEHIKGKFGVDALSRVIDQLQDTDIKKVYDNVKDRIRRGVLDVRKVRERIMTTRKGSEEDQAALLYDLAELKGRESELQKDIISETDADRKKELQNQLMQVQNDMMDNAIANRLLGRAASSIFRLRQVWADRGMDLVDFEEQYKASKGISELSEDQKTAVKKEFDEINQLKTERDNARAELDKAKAENERIIAENNKLKQFENKAKEQKKADRNKKTDETIDKSNKRIQDAKDNLRKLRGDMNDVTRVLPRVAAEISKIAAEKFYQGVVKAHELVLNVLDEVKDVFPHWTEDDVRAHLFPEFDGNEPLRYSVEDYRASSEKVQKKLDAYKRLNAEYAQKMFEWQRDRRSDIMGKRPLKERVIDGILRWQRFAVLSYPTTVIKLASVVGWNLVAKPFKLVLQKAIYEMANLPSRLSGGYFKNPLAKAPTWGNVSLSSIGKYYSAFIRNFSATNLKEQFSGLDTKEIMYGKGMYYDEWAAGKGFLEMPGRSHGYIKSFVKNPEFVFAHEQLLTHALKNMDTISKQLDNPNLSEAERTALKNDYDAIDITNIDNLEKINTLALEHGKWAILMNDNKFVEKFRNWADQKTITSALIRSELPIIKIPVNYIGRAFAIKYGLFRAIAGKGRWEGSSTSYPGMVEMMIKGTKDLTPEQADMFGKVLNLGSMGLAFFLMGYLNRDKIKHNEDGSVEFFGKHISKNLVHSPEFESMFNGSEVGNKTKGKNGEGFVSAMVEADFDMAKKNPFAQTLEYGFIANVAGAMLQKGETKGKTVDRVVDAAYKKIADMIEPGATKQVAGWMDTKDKGFHPMNDPIRRKPAGDKFERFYQTLELGIPGLRDNVPKNKHKQ